MFLKPSALQRLYLQTALNDTIEGVRIEISQLENACLAHSRQAVGCYLY